MVESITNVRFLIKNITTLSTNKALLIFLRKPKEATKTILKSTQGQALTG